MSEDVSQVEADSEASWGEWAVEFAKVWIAPLVIFVVVMQGVSIMRAPNLPEFAPDFELRTPDGDTVSLSDFEGQTVVLNFWATWCGPCRTEIPSFSKFAGNNPDIPVLGIAADGSAGKLKAAGKQFGIEYPILMGDRQTLAAYQISAYPTTVVVGPDGRVVTAHVGLMFGPQLWWATY